MNLPPEIEKIRDELAKEEWMTYGGEGIFTSGFNAAAEIFMKREAELEAKLALAISALEFYADKNNWKSVTIEDTHRRFCILIGADLEYFEDEDQNSFCGKRARKTLSQLKSRESK